MMPFRTVGMISLLDNILNMSTKQHSLLPLSLIIIGGLWLLNWLDMLPKGENIISIILFILGSSILIIGKINKKTVVMAPMLIYLSVAIYANYHYAIDPTPLLAVGMIIAGCLMLLAQSNLIPPKSSRSFPHPPQN